MQNGRGFTLLEVLVALAVLAIALSSLLVGIVQYSRNAVYLKESTLAGWVARNLVSEWQLKLPWPEPEQVQGKMEMADHQWYWRLQVSNTEDPGVRRIDVEVRLHEDDKAAIADVVGYIGKK